VTVVSGESLEEVSVTGARADRPRAQPHKGVAPPVHTGQGRLFSRNNQAPAAPPPAEAERGAFSYHKPPQVEGNDKFQHFEVNSIKQPALADERVSTFSADVDTSSYSFVRKQLMQGLLPQKDAVRAEEMINYFDYAWPAAESREQPFRPTIVVSDSPWGKGRKLIHIGIKGYELPANKRPDANIVMLLDVSGSMDSPDKLPLVKQSMKLLLGSLKPTDTVAIVVYAGAAGLVLPPTQVGEKEKIVAALDSLAPGGSTAGAEGIELAYQLAERSFRKEGVNRILLCTDGDFNVGIAGTEELKGFVERKREKGVFLSVLGFGQGNYRDELAQALAQNGNGVAAYIDSLSEAQKVLVQQAGSSLFTIAKDVKFQVEFNPATVAEYRLIGYETRALKTEDFNNDKIDAGDIGAGHTVTAIYEITPVSAETRMIGPSRYVKPPEVTGNTSEYGHLQMRYKLPNQDTSTLIQQPILVDSGGVESRKMSEAVQRDVGFSTAVAGFAQLLRGGQYTGKLSYDDVIRQALATRGEDAYGYRSEFVQLVRKAQAAR
jgi:Ca-activated chloride channel family protein